MDEIYFASDSAEEVASEMADRFNSSYVSWSSRGLVNMWIKCYNHVYGRQFANSTNTPALVPLGEQGELTGLVINQLGSIIKSTKTLVTQQKLVFDVTSTNSDVDSRNACIVGNAVLDKYFLQGKQDSVCSQALDLALIFGSAWIYSFWKPFNKFLGYNGQGQPVYSGGIGSRALSPLDVMMEPYFHDDEDHNWCCIREMMNRHDVISLHPEKSKEVLAIPVITEMNYFYDPYIMKRNDMVWVYTFYHKPTHAMPKGRIVKFMAGELVLEDGENIYKQLPIHHIRPQVRYGSTYGVSPCEALIPVQEALNILNSSIITNQKAFGVQNIVVDRQAGLTTQELEGGLKVIEVTGNPDMLNGGAPAALQLCSTPAEIFNYRQSLVQEMGMISGVNGAVRGDATGASSGAAIALQASQANLFVSDLQHNYVKAVESFATHILTMVRDFQSTEETVSVVGKSNQFSVMKFKGKDLAGVAGVRVQVGNPMSKTLAGRVNSADNLLKAGILQKPSQYLQILETGTLQDIQDDINSEDAYINAENEALLRGEQVQVIALDQHVNHIAKHKILTMRVDIRQNQQLISGVLAHLQEHIDQLDQMALGNPSLLSLVLTGQYQPPMPVPETRTGPAGSGQVGEPDAGQGDAKKAQGEAGNKASEQRPADNGSAGPTSNESGEVAQKAAQAQANGARAQMQADAAVRGGAPQ